MMQSCMGLHSRLTFTGNYENHECQIQITLNNATRGKLLLSGGVRANQPVANVHLTPKIFFLPGGVGASQDMHLDPSGSVMAAPFPRIGGET